MEREEMPVDVLFVGGGPACLAGAIHLMNLITKHNEAAAKGDGEELEPFIALIEKGSEIGAHQLSGAVLDPISLDELIPDWKTRDDFPVERYVEREEMVMLTETGKVKAPWLPAELKNKGKPVVSLGKLCAWLAEIAEEKEVNILPGFAGAKLLWNGDAVAGVQTGDKGIGKDGKPKDNFEPGYEMPSTVTILGEGSRGHLTKELIRRKNLDADSQPMVYEIGVKEVIELPPGTINDGFVSHMIGYPLDSETFGGGFLYHMSGDKVALGLLVALDAKDPDMDAHQKLQELKAHPYIKGMLGEGTVIKYGAKAVAIGGWASMPKLYTDGAMLVGDSASFLNPFRVKGIHLAMKSGMLAAEAAFEALKSGKSDDKALSVYKEKVDHSWIKAELEPRQNFHAGFAGGLYSGMVKTGFSYLFGSSKKVAEFAEDHTHIGSKGSGVAPKKIEYDGKYHVDKLSDVYLSSTNHEEQQPSHLKVADLEICATTCAEEYGNPCTKFCPAQVYNMRENVDSGRLELEVDFANCVHCKTCDIRDPYQIITWVAPEGGDGPQYDFM